MINMVTNLAPPAPALAPPSPNETTILKKK
jgi:hypothetical protein